MSQQPCSLLRSQWAQFEQHTLDLRRVVTTEASEALFVAILSPEKSPLESNDADAYLWIRAKPHSRFQKIRDAALKQHSPPLGLVLVTSFSMPGGNEPIGNFEVDSSKTVVMHWWLPTFPSAAADNDGARPALASTSGNRGLSSGNNETEKKTISHPSSDAARIEAWASQAAAMSEPLFSAELSGPLSPLSSVPSFMGHSNLITVSQKPIPSVETVLPPTPVSHTPVSLPHSIPAAAQSSESAGSPRNIASTSTHAPSSKLYKDGIDVFGQHIAAKRSYHISEYERRQGKPAGAATMREVASLHWHGLREAQQRSYSIMADLNVPFHLLDNHQPERINSEFAFSLRTWKQAVENGQQISFGEQLGTINAVPDLPNAEDVDVNPSVSLDFQGYFGGETQTEPQPEPESMRAFKLQELLVDLDPDKIEAFLEKGIEYLNELVPPLIDKVAKSGEATQWMGRIGKLHKQAERTRTIIGVVGNTGSGKSSMINALLDEERLVPTNAMRACTAVVTELSYNYETSEPKYLADIEFISAESWATDLKLMFQDLLDPNGNVSSDCTEENSDAGIAYAKIKAVYPNKTKEEIARSDPATLMNQCRDVLGTTRKLKDNNPENFYKKLQHFVDSKEKTKKKKDAPPPTREYWPLIKVVRIYTRSPALATGAVIVDLPGVHDQNVARAAVAETYLKNCTGLWIVAPIIRAVDDKAAKTLLGDSFKRQLKLDGGYNNVTFICSKTDDMSIEEISKSLSLEEDNPTFFTSLESAQDEDKKFKPRLLELKEELAVFAEIVKDLDAQIDEWEILGDKVEDGGTVYPPKSSRNGKRKAAGSLRNRSKKLRISEDSDDDFIDDASSAFEDAVESGDEELSTDVDDDIDAQSSTDLLTADVIKAKITGMKDSRKHARASKAKVNGEIASVKEQQKKVKAEIAKQKSAIARKCIDGRNNYSETAIQHDFAAGMKELDQEIAQEEDEENFNPDEDIRDYDTVAKNLPVFCISSRGYQKLSGRMKKDADVPGFDTPDQTQIPQLQAHCKQLTVNGRKNAAQAFATNLSQLLNSLRIWADVENAVQLSDEAKQREQKQLGKNLSKLERGFETILHILGKEINAELLDNITEKLVTGVQACFAAAKPLAEKWGSPINRENRAAGGYHWMTFKALCRRNGVYSTAHGHHDLNEQLTEPLVKQVSTGWERTFTRLVPRALTNFTVNSDKLVTSFHADVHKRAIMTGNAIAAITMLESQLGGYKEIFKLLAQNANELVSTKQRDINREFVPKIAEAMTDAYEACAADSGTGSYARAKVAVKAHVESQRSNMFAESAEHIRDLLREMVREVKRSIEDRLEEQFITIQRDYRGAVLGGDIQLGEEMPKWQRKMRASVLKRVQRAQWHFESAIGLDVGPPPGDALSEYGDDATTEMTAKDVNMVSESGDITANTVTEDVNMISEQLQTIPTAQPADDGTSLQDSEWQPGTSPIGGFTDEKMQQQFHGHRESPARPKVGTTVPAVRRNVKQVQP